MSTVGLRIGRYEVGERLGKGGFGVVHLAHDIELGREVAIKFLRAEFKLRLQVVQRFLQEARACAKIGHPGIVTVFEAGIVEGTGQRIDGTAYIVMERLRGESLGDRIESRGRMPAIAAIGIARQLAAALHVAHDAGIIHRDLKPDNIFLVKDAAVVGGERVKILDFGVAKLSDPDPDEDPNTHSQMMLGTPRYMSPEQARAASKVDHRTDIYALGCLLYELVCGKPPFGGDIGDVLVAHQTAPITPPRELVPSVPAALDELIVRMLAKEPDARPPTMRAVDDALDLVFGSLAPKKRAKTSPDEEKTTPHTPLEDTTKRRPLPHLDDDDDKTTRRVEQPEHRVELETPTSMKATIIQRPPGLKMSGWWRWRFAIGAGAAVLSGLIVYLILRRPANRVEPVAGSAVATVDAGPPDAPVEQPDATMIVVPADAPATDALVLACKQAQVDKQWTVLADCGQELSKTRPDEAKPYLDRAILEARAEVGMRNLETAIKGGELKEAAKLVAAIPESSVYRRTAQSAYNAAKGPVLDGLVAELNTYAAAKDCGKHAARLRAVDAKHGPELADEARLHARPCARAATAPAPPTGLPTPLDACDPDTVAAEERRGDASLTMGNFAAALDAYEKILKCRPEAVRKAYLSACRAKSFPKAKRYFKMLPAERAEALAQICMKEGYDPR
jgi:serine/threonine protein kinase